MNITKVTSEDRLEWVKHRDQEVRLADAVDGTHGAAMTVGFARYEAGATNAWTVVYDEALVVTKGTFTVRWADRQVTAGVGEVIYLPADTPLEYHSEQGAEVVYVTYPHWLAATEQSPQAPNLADFEAV
jgi:ethanolamine utilization protein EutQ